MHNRISFLFALIALVAVALPQGAQAGTPVPQTYSCAAGSFLVGFQGHTGNWIDEFQPICAPWDPVHQRLGAQVAGDAFGNINGGSPNLSSAICLPDSVIYEIDYHLTFPNGPPGHLQWLRISCQNIITGSLDLPQSNIWAAPIRMPQPILGPYPGDNPDANTVDDTCPGIFSSEFSPSDLLRVVAYSLIINLDGINVADLQPRCDKPKNIEAAAGPAPVHITAEQALKTREASSKPPAFTDRALRARVAWNQPPAAAPVPGSWYQSCSNASLYQNVLTASCKSTTGLDVTSSLNLTTCNQPASAANINGMLVCQSGTASTGHNRPN